MFLTREQELGTALLASLPTPYVVRDETSTSVVAAGAGGGVAFHVAPHLNWVLALAVDIDVQPLDAAARDHDLARVTTSPSTAAPPTPRLLDAVDPMTVASAYDPEVCGHNRYVEFRLTPRPDDEADDARTARSTHPLAITVEFTDDTYRFARVYVGDQPPRNVTLAL